MKSELQKGDSLYPARLDSISSPPRRLYCDGDAALLSEPQMIAIVGPRRPSAYGLEATRTLVRGLVTAGWCVVSGLAEGIDGAAHQEALNAGGKTIGVIGCGLDVVYPAQHATLYQQIAASGLIVSEYPLGTPPRPGHFPQRNRIISGLARGVVVVEAAEKSGALITAELALQQGREVFAVPGSIFSNLSIGTNGLIAQGAKLTRTVSDITGEFSWNVGKIREQVVQAPVDREKSPMTSDEKMVYSLLEGIPLSVDEIVERTNFAVDRVSTLLTTLELSGRVRREAGNMFSNIS